MAAPSRRLMVVWVGTCMLSIPARVLVAVALVASVGCTFIPANAEPAALHAASFLPADTWLFGEVNLRPSLMQLAGATRLANAFTSQPGWMDYVQRSSAIAGTRDSSVATDALALLDGEVAVGAFGSPSMARSIVGDVAQSTVVLAHSSDPDRLISMLAPAAGLRLTPRKDAHGANVYAIPGDTALATLKGWIVLASTQAILDETLDRINGASNTASLNDNPRFKNLVSRLPSDRLALEYVDTGALVRGFGSQLPVGAPGLSPDTLALLPNLDSQVAISFAAAEGGLDFHLEGSTHVPPDLADAQAISAQAGDPGDAFIHLPQDTLAAFGTGLPMLGPEFDAALNVALLQAAEELDVPGLAELEVHPGQWLAGPIALGGSAGTIGEPDGQPDLFAVAQLSDADAARVDLASVTALFPPKTATPLTVAGARFVQVPAGDDRSLTYGVADDWLYATTGQADALVGAAASGGLAENPRFAALQSGLGDDRTNVFIDLQGLRELGTSMLDDADRLTYESEVRPLVSPLTFFGGGARSESNGDVHGHFLLGISSVNSPTH
jgi:hypothetical protein